MNKHISIPNIEPNIPLVAPKTTLANRVFDEIKRDIVTGKLRPNQRLVESGIANKLGVSRTPVREALKRLEMSGYVRITASNGLAVTEHTAEEMQNLFDIREALETKAIKLACERATKEQIDKAVSCYNQMVEAVMNRKYDEYIELHSQFHEALYSPCGNEQLLSFIQTFRYQFFSQRLTRLYTRVFNNTLDTRSQIKKHRKILEALCDRNANRAEKALIRHLRTTLKLAVQLY